MTGSEKRHWIANRQERVWVYIALVLAAAVAAWGGWTLWQHPSPAFHTREFKGFFKDQGSVARILLFIVLAHYVLRVLFQKGVFNRSDALKKWMAALSRLARKLHTPAAVLAIAFILVHAAGAILYEFELKFEYVSGLLALLVLLPVPVLGLLRYRMLDKAWHLRLGIAFAVLFLIHSFL
ncbi:hypothetical protein ACFSO0_06120 [Brevibacillus sp. GCM10020057]|uniref:hypothetical protein n=1 Tax=Brevibacillus sp. GCM10020057 TaxID=3317327 RepID=UPI00362DB89A